MDEKQGRGVRNYIVGSQKGTQNSFSSREALVRLFVGKKSKNLKE